MREAWLEKMIEKIPATAQLRLFGLAKIPLIFLVQPKILRIDNAGAEVLVPLNYVTRNHLGSMYFGALTIGADCLVGALALHMIKNYPDHIIAPIFKDLHADFIKRAENGVVFRSETGAQIAGIIAKTIASGERVTESILVEAIDVKSNEVVARFQMGLSLKAKSR